MNSVIKLIVVMTCGLVALGGCGLRHARYSPEGSPAATGSVSVPSYHRGCH